MSPGADGSLWSLVVAPVLKRLLDKKVFACASLPTVQGQVKVQWVDAKEALFFDIEQDTEVVIHLVSRISAVWAQVILIVVCSLAENCRK